MKNLTNDLVREWLERTLGIEKGEVDDPNDAGGHTKWGISERTYPDIDISSLTAQDAANIYVRDFINPMRLYRYDDGVAFQLFDFAVHSSIDTAVKQFQRALNVTADGIVGPITLDAMDEYSEAELAMLIIAARLEFMTTARTWDHHGKGWVRRMVRNLGFAVEDV